VSTPTPRISVILATYNYPSVLHYAIRTVLWQHYTEFELLVIGDGCTDHTAEVVNAFGDARIRWHNLPENTGNQSGPNNAGLALARGEFIAYMHQDDLWFPTHLGTLLAALRTHDVPLASTLILRISPTPHAAEPMRAVRGLPGSGAFGPDKVSIETPSVMHRTETARQLGGWRDWRTLNKPPMLDFFERMIGPDQQFVTVPAVTVIKFHSAERSESYRKQHSHEQAAYFERLSTEPAFLPDELLKALDAQARGWQPVRLLTQHAPPNAPPGWYINQLRRVRGLPTDSIYETPTRPPSLLKRWLWAARKQIPRRLRRRLGKLFVRVGDFLVQ
jgi:Glycosyl transferase family 2